MNHSEIAVAPMHRLCKNAGADRVSEASAKELAKALEDIGGLDYQQKLADELKKWQHNALRIPTLS